ncbi:MAG: hypothetical protein F4X65_07810 [Chloroflexi bacterium]|nr:hypothetical protein [Chloroflexota bacterium]
MIPGIRSVLVVLTLLASLLALAACQRGAGTSPDATATTEVASGNRANAFVSGSVTYRERLALTPGARLEVELRDTSLQDAAAPLVAEQVIENPGQVPIEFEVGYNRDDINSRNTYSIQARIIEDDGRLAFINDTAYDVITRGNPGKVEMVLVMVQPPPPDPASGDQPVDPNEWVVAEYPITGAEMLPPHEGDYLQVFYLQSELENCSRRGESSFEIDGDNIRVSLTHHVPPPASWSVPCDEQLVELDDYINLEDSLEPGRTYHVFVNGQRTTTFSRPSLDFPPSEIALPDVVETTINILESFPPQYSLQITYGIPAGSGCSQENGYAIRRKGEGEIAISLTYHRVARGEPIMCTADYPIKDISIPLGADFSSGQEYTVLVNGEEAASFTAQ